MGSSAPATNGSRRASTRVPARRRLPFRFPIGWKFLLLLAAVVPSMVAVSLISANGLTTLKARLDRVYEDNLASTRVEGRISAGLREAEMLAQRLVTEPNAEAAIGLQGELRERVEPRVEILLFDLRRLSEEEPDDLALAVELERSWHTFIGFTDSPEFLAAAGTRSAEA